MLIDRSVIKHMIDTLELILGGSEIISYLPKFRNHPITGELLEIHEFYNCETLLSSCQTVKDAFNEAKSAIRTDNALNSRLPKE